MSALVRKTREHRGREIILLLISPWYGHFQFLSCIERDDGWAGWGAGCVGLQAGLALVLVTSTLTAPQYSFNV